MRISDWSSDVCSSDLTDELSSTYKLYQLASNMTGTWVEPQVYSNYAEALHAYVRESQAILFASYVSIAERLKPGRLVAIPLKNPEMHARTVQVQVMRGSILESEERRVGKECVSTGRSRWWRDN